MMNMNTPMLNQTINIKITMKWDNQGEEQEGKNPDNQTTDMDPPHKESTQTKQIIFTH